MSLPADPEALARALARLGLHVTVESHGALAILVPIGPPYFPSAAERAEIVRAGRDAGFASVALELTAPDADGASHGP